MTSQYFILPMYLCQREMEKEVRIVAWDYSCAFQALEAFLASKVSKSLSGSRIDRSILNTIHSRNWRQESRYQNWSVWSRLCWLQTWLEPELQRVGLELHKLLSKASVHLRGQRMTPQPGRRELLRLGTGQGVRRGLTSSLLCSWLPSSIPLELEGLTWVSM